ncbi:MAG TPA: hypothetical protein VFG68_01035 [Fimbriiglobus sp.]|nr:hypothetical protein [Fimbriiglobus sp.]
MTITIKLSDPVERKLAELATRDGKTVETVARELIERGVAEPRSLAEIMAPFAAEVAASGMTDDELGTFFAKELADMRQEKREASR